MRIPLERALLGVLLASLPLLTACDDRPTDGVEAAQGAPGAAQQAPTGDVAGAEGLVFLPAEGADPERPNFHDFGIVSEGAVLHHTFSMVNRDPRPVEIQRIDPACGCTVARLTKETVEGELETALTDRPGTLLELAPDEIVHVALTVDADEVREKNVDKLFMVRVTSDSVTTPFITMECHLIVRQHFQLAPAALDLGDVPLGALETGRVTIKALPPDDRRLVGLRELPPGVVAELEVSPLSNPESEIWTLQAGFEPAFELGRRAAEVRIMTTEANGQPAEDVVVQLTATASDPITVHPPRLILRPAPDGGTARIQAELVARLAGQRVDVIGFSIEGSERDALSFSAEPFQPSPDGTSARWNLALETRTLPGASSFQGMIVIELDDPALPRLEVPYVGLGF